MNDTIKAPVDKGMTSQEFAGHVAAALPAGYSARQWGFSEDKSLILHVGYPGGNFTYLTMSDWSRASYVADAVSAILANDGA